MFYLEVKYCFRIDSNTIELLTWYEVIFGKEMWKHVIIETTFWKHGKADVLDRQRTRKINESILEKNWQEEIYKKLAVSKNILIPSVFIDPVVDIFVDPCNEYYMEPESREIVKFIENVDK